MKAMLLVALGGAIGSVARWSLSAYVLSHTLTWRLPLGTLAVNALGCFAAGFLAGAAERHQLFTTDTRLFLFAGVLGGFTTFSAFSLETMHLLRSSELVQAAANIGANVLIGLLAIYAGLALAGVKA